MLAAGHLALGSLRAAWQGLPVSRTDVQTPRSNIGGGVDQYLVFKSTYIHRVRKPATPSTRSLYMAT